MTGYLTDIPAVVMAGGEGARLRPLTCDRPKPLVPVVNRPVLAWALDLLRGHGVRRAVLTLHYLAQAVLDDPSVRAAGLALGYTVEKNPLGTAGGVARAAREAACRGTVLVVSGDALTDIDLAALVAFHRKSGAVATLGLAPVLDPSPYGAVVTGGDGAVLRFIEKPGPAEACSEWVNTGIYVLEPEALAAVPRQGPSDFSQDLFPRLLAAGRPVFGWRSTCYWCDIGNIAHYLAANWDVLGGRVALPAGATGAAPGVDPQATISESARLTPPVAVGPGAVVQDGARVGPFAVLGAGAVVGAGASVKRAVLWEGARVGPRAEVRGAVVGARASLGRRARAFQGAVVGDRARVGPLATLRPQSRLWPDKEVAGGAVVEGSVVWETSVPATVVAASALRGAFNAELTPEFAARLGAALAAVVAPRSPVLVGGDARPESQALRVAIAAGLAASGARVLDAGRVAAPVARHAARSLPAAAAHVRGDAGGSGDLIISLCDLGGAPLQRGAERKLDAAITGGDFPRPPAAAAGAVEYLPATKEAYVSSLVGALAARSLVRRGAYRLIAVFDPQNLGDLLSLVADELGLVLYNGAGAAGSPHAGPPATADLAWALRRHRAHFAFSLAPNGEDLRLVLPDGQTLDRHRLAVLEAYLSALTVEPGAEVALPPGAPRAAAAAVMAAGRRPLVPRSAAGSPFTLPAPGELDDGVSRLVRILDLMAATGADLAAAAGALPAAAVREVTVACPLEARAAVIRRLAESRARAGSRVHFGAGLGVEEASGVTLLLPDPHRPAVRIVAEAASWELAGELAAAYARDIRRATSHPGVSGAPETPQEGG